MYAVRLYIVGELGHGGGGRDMVGGGCEVQI